MPVEEKTLTAALAVERLRLAEARLARRRQTQCGPSETARAAMRYILERADDGSPATPTEIAEHLGLATASMTGILHRLRGGGLITFQRNPDDGRSKRVVPVDRSADIDEIDPLTARIREFAGGLTEREADHVARFLEAVTEAVDGECL
ncbi:MarR family winged helix-turn-helix transcriptional regulator [Microbacterium sp. CFBP9034]|uniref:MarR family winged helix-turn-helix transcriptional regulator n=1 Tax=Microbacterium sp. CFBP9034 TaxID=3096540 RepID=UPI002A69BBA4|nr:MarR family transcriptional regulator [Microbacterium sp. CFBP9034]MDY0911113.1 MarR family transcriptional regulator [Microbacterium sp. CFBP9034]